MCGKSLSPRLLWIGSASLDFTKVEVVTFAPASATLDIQRKSQTLDSMSAFLASFRLSGHCKGKRFLLEKLNHPTGLPYVQQYFPPRHLLALTLVALVLSLSPFQSITMLTALHMKPRGDASSRAKSMRIWKCKDFRFSRPT